MPCVTTINFSEVIIYLICEYYKLGLHNMQTMLFFKVRTESTCNHSLQELVRARYKINMQKPHLILLPIRLHNENKITPIIEIYIPKNTAENWEAKG